MMPSEDRLWLSLRWFGYAIPVLAMLAAADRCTRFLDAWGPWPSALAQLDWNALWNSLLFVLVGVATGVYIHWRAKRAGERQRLRARAMAGDDRAMLLAAIETIEPQATPAIEALDEPLALVWRPPWSWWIVPIALVTALGLVVVVGGIGGTLRSNQSLWVDLVVWALFAGIMLAIAAYWRKGPSGVVTTEAGLRRLEAGKARAFIPWSQARLFEVWSENPSASQSERGFALMSERTLIQWVIHPSGKALPAEDGTSDEEMRRRAHALVQTVIARTGLAPRTCQPELALREDADSAAAPR